MIQELLIQDHVVRFNVGLNYGNQTRRDVFSLQNQDEFSAQIGIRCGLTPTIEASMIENARSSNAGSSAEDHFVYGRIGG